MPSKDFIYDHHIVSLFPPVADAFAGGIDSDVICLRDYRRATCVIQTGAIEDTGISNLITVLACTDASKTGATAIAFHRRFGVGSTSDDSIEALAAVASSGYNFADRADAAANNLWIIEVTAEELAAGLASADFFHLTIAETANKTITAGGIVILSEPRFSGNTPLTAIA